MRFRATLEQSGKTATRIQIPDEVVQDLGAGKRPAVRVTINGHTYRNTAASMGGRGRPSTGSPTATSSGTCFRSREPRRRRLGNAAP